MNVNPNDPLVTLPEAAARMGVNVRRARNLLVKNMIHPIRTQRGICYRLDDVDATRRMGK